MATFTVTTELIESPQAEAYFTRADRRVMIGLRATLEMLRLPVPNYAQRRKPGATPAKAALAAYVADNPTPRRMILPERKPNATPERIAAVQAAKAAPAGQTPALYDQVFSG
ncbi:MAG: hypothetical protein H0W74_14015 [Sphingosinicella sp.]|nr:hypothetical protein [Sphingosinicella sp.]